MNVQIAARAGDVSLLIEVAEAALPEVVYWGADVGEVSAETWPTLHGVRELPVAPNAPDVPLRLGLMPEARFGWMGKPGLIGSRDGGDWTPSWHVTEVRADGAPVTGAMNIGAGVIEFDALSDTAGLALCLTVELTPHGLIRTRAMLTNLAADSYRLDDLTLAFPVPSQAREICDFAGRWGAERIPQRQPLSVGQHRREGRHGRTGADSAYVLHVGVPGFGYADGEIWAVHTAWSGNHVHYAERDYLGVQVIGGGELLLPGEVQLAKGQSYTSPWLYANYAVGLDAVAARFHDFLRDRPSHPNVERPVTLNVWEAVYFDHDSERLLDLADRAAQLGVERYVLDDGWFGARRHDRAGLGDWVVSSDVWPNGLHPLIERVKAHGMQFGLWFEPEMVNLDSDVARAHPDWIMAPSDRLPIESRTQQVLNLGLAPAYAHVRDHMMAIFDEYAIDYVKWDHNRDLIDAGTNPGGKPGVREQTLAFYRLLDELRAAHPEIEFESCSSGGGRVDLEVMQRAERVWVSDNIDPEERQRMLWWTGQLLPTEMMGSHIASGRSHTTARWHDLNFRALTAVFGHLGIEWDLALASEEELAALRGWIDWYKANRAVLHTGRLVRVDMADPEVYFKGIVTPHKAIFSLSMLKVTICAGLGMLRFPGLDPDANYRVTMTDPQLVPPTHWVPWRALDPVVLPGRLLANIGLRAPHLQPSTAVLFELERV